jgi:TatA/E family protein of Tat protein translocase
MGGTRGYGRLRHYFGSARPHRSANWPIVPEYDTSASPGATTSTATRTRCPSGRTLRVDIAGDGRPTQEAIVDPGPAELLVVLVVVLLVFGSKKLPELARGLGEAVHELRHAQNDNALNHTAPNDTDPRS